MPTHRSNDSIVLTYIKIFGNNIADENNVAESATFWLTEIETANEAYMDLYENRTSIISEDKKVESFIALRPAAKKAYDELVKIIEARYNTAVDDGLDASVLKTCIDDINTTIEQYKQLIIATATSKKDEPKTGDRKEEDKKN